MNQRRAKVTLSLGGSEVLWKMRKNFMEERLSEVDSEGQVALPARGREGVMGNRRVPSRVHGRESSGNDQ